MIGPLMVGQLFDWTGKYDISNTASCISIELGVICMLGTLYFHKREAQPGA